MLAARCVMLSRAGKEEEEKKKPPQDEIGACIDVSMNTSNPWWIHGAIQYKDGETLHAGRKKASFNYATEHHKMTTNVIQHDGERPTNAFKKKKKKKKKKTFTDRPKKRRKEGGDRGGKKSDKDE